MFDWSTLAYIASAVKAPYETQTRVAEDSKGFLKVDDYDDVGHTDDDVPRHPYEVVPLSHIRDALGYEFKTLVSAIESCLSDIDLSVNEVGFLLLMRRFLPNGLMSEYALRRLTRALLGWILSEDDSLATILREYVSLGRELPGVRAASDPIPWPFARDSRRIPSSSVNNGGDYVASRRALLHAYVVEWLLTLHNQDVSAFPSIVFDATHEIATEYACSTNLLAVSQNHDRHWDIADRCLKFILKLYQASVTFTALDELFLLWLKSLEYDVLDKASFPTLQRLLNRDGESAARFSTYVDATLANADDKGLQLSDLRLLLSSGMVNKEEIDGLPARKKLNVRTERAVDPVIVDQDLILTLNDYIQCGCEELAGLAAQFLHFLMTSSSFLEAYEIDNFILRNGKTLCLSVWKLYDVHDPRISNVRTSLLLRILVVDVVPFRALLMETFSSSSPWESRLCGACRLFRVIMDVKSPAFRIEDRQWRLSVLDVFYFFFQLMWLDPKEEIRTAVGTWSQTLLPPHLEAIATCWNGALPALQQPERLRLVTFLIQLQPHFPTWKILSWNVVVEVLLEGDSERAGKEDILVATGPTAMILLSLQMMESGSEVDILTLLKLKLHLAKVLGFTDVEAIATPGGKAFFIRFEQLETMPASCFPCVHALPRILDAPHDFELPPSVMGSSLVDEDKPCHVLIGTVFVDLVLAIMCSSLDLLALPVLTLKNLLEALLIITFKHDFDSMTIKHLDVSLRKALRKALDLLLLDISYELRQLALSVVQTHIRKGTGISGVLAVDSMDKATALIVSLRHNKDDFLVSQATSFIEYTLVTLTPSGIFCSLCRRPPNPDFYEILKGIINGRNGRESVEFQEDLLRSIILQPPEVDWKVTHNTVQNINMFVEVVLSERVNDTVLKDLATWTVATARRASGLSSSNDFDLNSLICLVANLMRFRRPSIHHDLFICLETIFRTALLRCDVRKETISLLCSAATHGSSGSTDAITLATQSLSRIMVENLDDILRLKIRVTPVTIISLVERQSRADTTIRSWIVLLLAALSDRSSAKHATLLLSQFEKFLHPYTKILGAYVLGQIPLPEMAAADIEYAYLAMKSWLLLLHKLSPDREMADPRGELTQKLWNELWPPFESLAKLLWEESSDEILPLLTAVWSSVANLFILVLQMRSAIAMDTIPCLALLDRLKQLGGKNSALNKLAKALDGDVLPELQKDNIISQMMKDTANAEKLRSLDSRTDEETNSCLESMSSYAFASLAHVRVLLIPVGSIPKDVFDAHVAEVRAFDSIRLGDIPGDAKAERARFMPSPLSTGYLHLSFTSHPSSPAHDPLYLFRPSLFHHAVIGFATPSASNTPEAVLEQFENILIDISSNSTCPLAKVCFVFQNEDSASGNLGEIPRRVVLIPSVMGNKKLYIGTLLADLCSQVLGEFGRVLAFEPIRIIYSCKSRIDAQFSCTIIYVIASISNAWTTHRQKKIKRAGRTQDAKLWYQEALNLFKTGSDPVWQASAIEGMAVLSVLDLWASGQGLQSSLSDVKEPWMEIYDQLSQVIALYLKSASPLETAQDYSLLAFVYTTAVLRQTSLLFCVWSSKGWGVLAFASMLQPGSTSYLQKNISDDSLINLERLSAMTGISRSHIANTLSQAHGPWLLHLSPRERLVILQSMASIYNCLGFRRKEVYVLREVISCVMDLIVCGREEDEQLRRSDFGGAGLAIRTGSANSDELVNSAGSLGVRRNEKLEGNQSILRLVYYICKVLGVNLEAVSPVYASAGDGSEAVDPVAGAEPQPDDTDVTEYLNIPFGWPELQVGVIREAIAVAEALPDYLAVARISLSALKTMHAVLATSDQYHLYQTASRALNVLKRRGETTTVEWWAGRPSISIALQPLPSHRLLIEKPISLLVTSTPPANPIIAGAIDPFLYNPRKSMNARNVSLIFRSTIRLTLENVSALPIDFLKLSFEDSTISPAQEALSDGELDILEAYETEYDLIHRKVFSWNPDKEFKPINAGRKIVLSVACLGKVGCTSGAFYISYAHVHREKKDPVDFTSETFYTRQLMYPVTVTVYHILECYNMNLISVCALDSLPTGHPERSVTPTEIDDLRLWCLFSIEVRNTYGLPFEVTFTRLQDGILRLGPRLIVY
ncbi:hypothetical protein ID866_1469 [Astraeus odoratus]|nr:hypothetical protein ID866_1469 [Astraeus odoratus]